MNAANRSKVRGRLVGVLLDAIDDEKANCGRLEEFLQILDAVVKKGRSRTLRCRPHGQHGHVFFASTDEELVGEDAEDLVLPTADELAEAVTACVEAVERRVGAHDAAEAAGADLGALAKLRR